MRFSKITLSLAALGLGTALASGAALAQDSNYPVGKNANDGGMISTPQFDKGAQRTGSNSSREAFRSGAESYSPGAQGQQPRTAPNAYNTAQSTPSSFNYPVGRNPNDGGFVNPNANTGGVSTAQFDKGAARSGSASAREAFRSGTDRYAFGAQGQPPRSAPNTYGYTTGNTFAQRQNQSHYYDYNPNWNGQ